MITIYPANTVKKIYTNDDQRFKEIIQHEYGRLPVVLSVANRERLYQIFKDDMDLIEELRKSINKYGQVVVNETFQVVIFNIKKNKITKQ